MNAQKPLAQKPQNPSHELVAGLKQALGDSAVAIDEPLSKHTTFKIGGPADILVQPRTIDEIRETIGICREFNAEWRVMGLGSDLLIADTGLRGVTIKLAEAFSDIEIDDTKLIACAGASNEQVAATARQAGLAGYEFASGIPGSIGGAAIMNAGAYGGEFKDVAESVLCLTPEGELRKVFAAEADWSYRHSMMNDSNLIVLQATLALHKDDPAAIQERMDDLAARRNEKQPLEMPSAGSTFKRPEGHFAGKLIQDAGLQGYRVGDAEVSRKHAGFVVNAGNATAAQVRQLIEDVQASVFEMSGVELEPEVRMWGF